MQGDDPGWRQYLQNFNYFVGTLEQTAQRDSNDAVIYGPLPAAAYPPRPLATAPAAEHTAYVAACQAADDARDALYPHGGPILNHRPPDSELKNILLEALAGSSLIAYKTLYQQYCNRSHNTKTYKDLYNDIHDLVKYESDGIKSSVYTSSELMEEEEDSDNTASTRSSAASHSSRRKQQIAAAALRAEQDRVERNTHRNSNILAAGSASSVPKHNTTDCKNCGSDKHITRLCPSTKCFTKGCGKTFKTAEERKTHYLHEHGYLSKAASVAPKSALKQSSKSQRQVKFKGANVNKVNQVTSSKQSKASSSSESGEVSDDNYDSEVSSSVNSVASHKPKRILVWEGTSNTHDSDQPSRKVSKIRSLRTVSLLRSASSGQIPQSDGDNTDHDMPPPLIRDSSDSDSDAEPMRHDLNLRNRITAEREAIEAPSEKAQTNPLVRYVDNHGHVHGTPSDIELAQPKPREHAIPPARKSHTPLYKPSRKRKPKQPAPPLRMTLRSNSCHQEDSEDHTQTMQPPGKHHASTHGSEEGTSSSDIRTGNVRDRETSPAKESPPSNSARTGITLYQLSDKEFSIIQAFRKRAENRQRRGLDPEADSTLTDLLAEEPIERDSDYSSDDSEVDVSLPARYQWYLYEGGQRKFDPADNGTENHYPIGLPVRFEEGNWLEDYNFIRPSVEAMRDIGYRHWFRVNHPHVNNIVDAVTKWLDRRSQLQRCQTSAPNSYEAELKRLERQSGYMYTPEAQLDREVWDRGEYYRLHAIRKQARRELSQKLGRRPTHEELDHFMIQDMWAYNRGSSYIRQLYDQPYSSSTSSSTSSASRPTVNHPTSLHDNPAPRNAPRQSSERVTGPRESPPAAKRSSTDDLEPQPQRNSSRNANRPGLQAAMEASIQQAYYNSTGTQPIAPIATASYDADDTRAFLRSTQTRTHATAQGQSTRPHRSSDRQRGTPARQNLEHQHDQEFYSTGEDSIVTPTRHQRYRRYRSADHYNARECSE
jgi:hypothetical protein